MTKPRYMILTTEERERYAGYCDYAEFEIGFFDYYNGRHANCSGVAEQTYDRGKECAMRREQRAQHCEH